MKIKLFLSSVIGLLSITTAYATCNPPSILKCECAHPILENGILTCGASYCGNKKCMPDGSCCESEKYCESTEQSKQCCADGQTCDATKGCVELTNRCENDYDNCSLTEGIGVCLSGKCYPATQEGLNNWCTDWCPSNPNSCGSCMFPTNTCEDIGFDTIGCYERGVDKLACYYVMTSQMMGVIKTLSICSDGSYAP